MRTSPVPRNVVARLLGIARRAGIDTQTLLTRSGIDGQIESARGPISVAQASALTQELWILTGDELFGLGLPAPLGSFQLLMRSAIHVPDLQSGLQRLISASQVLPAMPSLSATIDDDLVWVVIDVSAIDDPDHLLAELLASLIHRTLSWMTGTRIPLHRLTVPWSVPGYVTDYEDVFGVTPTFDAGRLAFAFSVAVLTSPVIRDEQALAVFLQDQPHAWFTRRDWGSTVADKVRAMLEQGLDGHWPTADDLADRLHVSAQHLRRQLRERGTSLNQLKQDVLRDAAIASLRRDDESVEHLATRLGFSEASAFRRAFHRWTNLPPSAYRTTSEDVPSRR